MTISTSTSSRQRKKAASPKSLVPSESPSDWTGGTAVQWANGEINAMFSCSMADDDAVLVFSRRDLGTAMGRCEVLDMVGASGGEASIFRSGIVVCLNGWDGPRRWREEKDMEEMDDSSSLAAPDAN